MDLHVPENEDPDSVIEIKRLIFKLIKKSIKCANNFVAAIPGISSSVGEDLHIDANYRPTNFQETGIPIDTLVNNSLNI